MVTTDASYLVCKDDKPLAMISLMVQEFAVTSTTSLSVQPFAIVAGIGLLIWLLGYSALVGVGVSHRRVPES